MNVVTRYTFDHLDVPTVIRRHFAAPGFSSISRWEALFISFVARVSTGELFWR